MGSFSIWHWLIVLLIVVLLFGTKKIKNLGADLGSAVKGFKDGVREGTSSTHAETPANTAAQQVSHQHNPASGGNPPASDANTIDVNAKTRS